MDQNIIFWSTRINLSWTDISTTDQADKIQDVNVALACVLRLKDLSLSTQDLTLNLYDCTLVVVQSTLYLKC